MRSTNSPLKLVVATLARQSRDLTSSDLIFGCKQQGHGAVDAYNVFHYLFYEGNVDIFRSVAAAGGEAGEAGGGAGRCR